MRVWILIWRLQMYTHIYTYVYTYPYSCTQYTRIDTYFICIYVYTYTHTHTHTCIYIYTYIHAHTHTRTHMHTHVHKYITMHMLIHLYFNIKIQIQIHTRNCIWMTKKKITITVTRHGGYIYPANSRKAICPFLVLQLPPTSLSLCHDLSPGFARRIGLDDMRPLLPSSCVLVPLQKVGIITHTCTRTPNIHTCV